MPPKKMGVNSKAVEARERKNEKKQVRNVTACLSHMRVYARALHTHFPAAWPSESPCVQASSTANFSLTDDYGFLTLGAPDRACIECQVGLPSPARHFSGTETSRFHDSPVQVEKAAKDKAKEDA